MGLKSIGGIPVVNATAPLRLHVSEGDIAKAGRKTPEDCALARCIRREHHAKAVRVHLGRIYVRSDKGVWKRYLTPKALRTEIIAFDRGGSFEAGEHTLFPPLVYEHRPKAKSNRKRAPRVVVKNVREGPAHS